MSLFDQMFPTASQPLNEGVFDPYILKAVFAAGSGGSGKSYLSGKVFGGMGLRVVNSDEQLEHLARKAGISLKTGIDSDEVQRPGGLRDRAKELTSLKQENYLEGRIGIIVDGTASKVEKIVKQKKALESIGYDCSMFLVNTPIEIALENNRRRSRVVPEHIIREDWDNVQEARPFYKTIFGPLYYEFKPTKMYTDQEIRGVMAKEFNRIANKLIGGPVMNPIGKEWIESQVGGNQQLRKLVRVKW